MMTKKANLPGKAEASDKAVGRLVLYRKRLAGIPEDARRFIYSHEIGELCGVTSTQVRRDLMLVGSSGNPNRGYERRDLAQSIDEFLFEQRRQKVILVGVGNLGRAVLAYVSRRSPLLVIVAAFDSDPAKTGRVIMGYRCHAMTELGDLVDSQAIPTGILSVPVAAAQEVADRLVAAGIRGILNFAPVTLRVPHTVYVEDIDLAMALEKVAFFARHGRHVERMHV